MTKNKKNSKDKRNQKRNQKQRNKKHKPPKDSTSNNKKNKINAKKNNLKKKNWKDYLNENKDYIEIENNMSKSLKKFKEINNSQPIDEIVINNKNLDNNNKSINNDFVYNKDNDLLKEIENQTNSEEINEFFR